MTFKPQRLMTPSCLPNLLIPSILSITILFIRIFIYRSCLALLLAFRILSPYLYSTNGIGINRIDNPPNNELAPPTPNFVYIAFANSGKPAPKLDLMKSLPAKTEAAYSGYASPR